MKTKHAVMTILVTLAGFEMQSLTFQLKYTVTDQNQSTSHMKRWLRILTSYKSNGLENLNFISKTHCTGSGFPQHSSTHDYDGQFYDTAAVLEL